MRIWSLTIISNVSTALLINENTFQIFVQFYFAKFGASLLKQMRYAIFVQGRSFLCLPYKAQETEKMTFFYGFFRINCFLCDAHVHTVYHNIVVMKALYRFSLILWHKLLHIHLDFMVVLFFTIFSHIAKPLHCTDLPQNDVSNHSLRQRPTTERMQHHYLTRYKYLQQATILWTLRFETVEKFDYNILLNVLCFKAEQEEK